MTGGEGEASDRGSADGGALLALSGAFALPYQGDGAGTAYATTQAPS